MLHLLALVTAALCVPASAAFADATSDFQAISADYRGTDGTAAADIVSCRFTREQLVNARNLALGSSDFAYDPAFASEVSLEIGRWDNGYCAGVAPRPGGGSSNPEADFNAVATDWARDGTITPCRFKKRQLQSTLNLAATVADFDLFAPGFRAAVVREIARIDRGRCRFGKLRIVRIAATPPSGARSEFVTLKNVGKAALKLGRMVLRDKSGNTIRLPKRSLRPGRSLRVRSGARKVWGDRGDVVKVLDADGAVVAQRGYGRFKGVPRF